ncbi:hypothetical protein C5O10_10275 [Akkermansia muciniphila]|uniref:integrase core domain-containing protein n=2 Tax=Akkermansia muciniphila TaxID=239935 RepID=UPI00138E85B2|nr:integrase core domain-containing protein [Akkermansia muciniphila]MDY5392477.1 integrase core domain-containing protein [Akkermansia muciniphila]QHV14687.1 hypothetical protein C5O09_10235 [Akkermansia muciniphila]QHV17157.1 hypothetical protein C5O10_10275 [Akkermansia muciniphila]
MERHGMGSRYQRLLKLEEQHLQEGKQFSQEQIQSIEKDTPCFKERHVESKTLGNLLCQDTLYAGQLKDVGRKSLYANMQSTLMAPFPSVTCTSASCPKTNGFSERFNRTVKEEFFDMALKRKLYSSVEELQKDLGEWLRHYNTIHRITSFCISYKTIHLSKAQSFSKFSQIL